MRSAAMLVRSPTERNCSESSYSRSSPNAVSTGRMSSRAVGEGSAFLPSHVTADPSPMARDDNLLIRSASGLGGRLDSGGVWIGRRLDSAPSLSPRRQRPRSCESGVKKKEIPRLSLVRFTPPVGRSRSPDELASRILAYRLAAQGWPDSLSAGLANSTLGSARDAAPAPDLAAAASASSNRTRRGL